MSVLSEKQVKTGQELGAGRWKSHRPAFLSSSRRLAEIGLPWLAAGLFFAFTYAYYPFQEKLQFDTDEGLNLMRSMLVALGHPLYAAVSSDQPPLFTHLLALLLRLVGFKVNPARALVLLFSSLLVWAGAGFLQLKWGRLAALALPLLLALTPRYLELSVSVMIGVPALALAGVALFFLGLWHRDGRAGWLALSGASLALSLLVKLFTGFLAPLFLAGLLLAEWSRQEPRRFSRKALRPALIWGSCFAGLGLLLGWLWVGPHNLRELLAPHVAAGAQATFQDEKYDLYSDLQPALPLLALGALGACTSLLQRRWLALYPAGWALLAFVFLNFYTPVFYHHQLLITIPAALLAAGALGEGCAWLVGLRRRAQLWNFRTLLAILALAGLVLVIRQEAPVLRKELRPQPRLAGFSLKATPGKLQILAAMQAHAPATHWVLTDMPLYAFRIGRPVPPALATFSRKRLATGSLTEQDILKALAQYRPEQVLLARFVIPSLEAALAGDYTLVLEKENFRLFLRRGTE